MAMNVFGNPITFSTLRGMVEYQDKEKKAITQLDKAKVALSMKNARGNDSNVCKFVDNIGKELSDHDLITYCVIYNATGDTIKFDSFINKDGQPAYTPFPARIANGQWAGFVHIGNIRGASSKGSVVYHGKNADGEGCRFHFAWENPYDRTPYYDHLDYPSRVKTMITSEGESGDVDAHNWGDVVKETAHGCVSTVSTGYGRKAVLEAVFTLEHADI